VIKRRIGPTTAAAVLATDAGPAAGTSVVATTRNGPKPKPRPSTSDDGPPGNGHSSSGLAGLGGLIRGRGKSPNGDATPVATRPAGPPPKPPRKKKKRSGRRR